MDEIKKQKYFKHIEENIAKNGYNVTSVLESKNFMPFSYSTAIFDNFKIPEVFISGLGPKLPGELIENYIQKYKFSDIPLNQIIYDLTDRFPVIFIKVKNENLTDYILTSFRHYGERNFEYIQLVFPDFNGKFPFEDDYDYDQKILGELKLDNLLN